MAAQSQHLIDASSLFRATVFGQSKHASYVLKPRTTLLKRRPSLWSLVSQVSLPPRLGWKRWLEEASVLKRCPHSAAAPLCFSFLAFFYFWNVSVSTSWAYRSSRHSSYPLIRARVCPRQTLTDGCWVCPGFLCFVFFKWDESTQLRDVTKGATGGPEINFACYGVQGSDLQVDPVCSFLTKS